MNIAMLSDLRPNPIHFMTEHQADRKGRIPVKQIHRMRSRLYRGDLETLCLQPVEQRGWVPSVFPPDRVLGTQRGLTDPRRWRRTRNASQQQHLQSYGVSGTEERPDIVSAADVVEQNGYRQPGNGIVGRSDLGGPEGEAVIQDVRLSCPGGLPARRASL